jgi:hypothetical protein
MDFARVEKLSPLMQAALDYAKAGRPVFPCGPDKKPLTRHGFKDASTDSIQIIGWWNQWPSALIGMPTGEATGIAVIDLDHKPNSAGQPRNGSAALGEITQGETWGDTVEVRTPTGGRHIWFQHRPGFKCSTNDELGIDVRAEGGYVCVPPSAGYIFENPPGLFPVIDAPDFLVPVLRDGTRQKPAPAPQLPHQAAVGQSTDETRPEDVAAVLAQFWNPDDYQDWSTAALAMHSLPGGREIWMEWAARSPKFDAAENDKKWRQTVPSKGITARSILARAPKAMLSDMGKSRYPTGPTPRIFSGEFSTGNGQGTENTGSGGQSGAAEISAIETLSEWGDDPKGIQPRPWIVPGLLIRRLTSVLAAPGGTGKSLLTTQQAIAVCIGMEWGGWKPVEACKALLVNAEDDHDELMRRIYSASKVMGVDPRSLNGRLHIAKDPRSIVVAKTGRDKIVSATPLVDAIKVTLTSLGISVIFVDPFTETFEGDENSNSEVKWAAAIWRDIARDCNCAVQLVHHTKKYAKDMAGDADASRGAGALVNSARIASTLFSMSEAEAATMDVPQDKRHLYVRFDDAKANLSLITNQAKWFEKVSHELGNGDSVGVLKPWKPPGMFEGVSIETINEVLAELDAGQKEPDGALMEMPFAWKKQSPAWGGKVIARLFNCNEARATDIFDAWAKSGLLFKVEYTTKNRKPGLGIGVNFTKKPGGE